MSREARKLIFEEKKKIAVLGRGKTGREVVNTLEEIGATEGQDYEVFHRANRPTKAKLEGFDLVIAFVDGEVFSELFPVFLASRVPVVSAATGLGGLAAKEDLRDEYDLALKSAKLTWIYANNFALSMHVLRELIIKLSELPLLLSDGEFRMHEIHHDQKKDRPSGTAKSWREWLQRDRAIPVEITSARTGDEMGTHELIFACQSERISLRHESLSRRIFSDGAFYAAYHLLTRPLDYGFLEFQTLVQKEFS